MIIKNNLTDIQRIGLIKTSGSEYSQYIKNVKIDTKPDFASIRLESTGICAVYINGEFLEVSCGRYPSRITYIEFTSMLKDGENEIKLVLGNNYLQGTAKKTIEVTGTYFSCFACEIVINAGDKKHRIVSDDTWTCHSDDGHNKPYTFSEITKAEYERFWENSALWQEQKPVIVDKAVTDVAGLDYEKLLKTLPEKYKSPEKIVETTFNNIGEVLSCDKGEGYVIYDFGRLHPGFLEIEYDTDNDIECKFEFDYTERLSDFQPGATAFIERLSITETLDKNKNSLMLLRRRAFRYLKISVCGKGKFTLKNVKMLLDMMPYENLGYFNCSDEKINKIWQVGKYTLHVNKKLEYESCPRNERKYFSGDGIIDALSDYYLFGDTRLTKASLALTEKQVDGGIRTDKLQKDISLADYPAWRIITVYNYYFYYADTAFVKFLFSELAACLEWMIERMNSKSLIFQHPIFTGAQYSAGLGPTAYNSSEKYLGTNPLFNALLYKSLRCMSELAEVVKDSRGSYWKELSNDVKQAFNNCLWNDEMKAFSDDYYKNIVFQDGNSLAVLFGLCDAEKSKTVLDTVKRENHTPYGSTMINADFPLIRGEKRTISPLMCTYEAEARFLNGDSDGAIDLIKRCWGTMIDKGAETFWEFCHNDGTSRWVIPSHAWSSGCTYLLGAYVLGIRPESLEGDSLIFEPYDGFESFEGVVPAKCGNIAVKCETVNGSRKYTLAKPKGAVVKTVLPENASLEIIEY